MTRYLLAGLVVAGLGLAHLTRTAAGPITPTPGPTLDGHRATVDLPAAQHMKNTSGSDGLGLCVFTSIEHAARWQNLIDLAGYRRWMESRPGGGWPEKVDKTLAEFCKAKGVPVPDYVQHTGGDDGFLDLVIRTGRCAGVTYSGRDGFYTGSVAHMVNLAELDADRAAVIDNNRPGQWVWMARRDFLVRWRERDGGWAIVFLAPPPTLYSSPPAIAGEQLAPAPIGTPPSDRHEWGPIPGYGYGWRLKDAGPEPSADPPTGVIPEKVHGTARYSLNGQPCSEAEARAALTDDSNRWHLAVVGEAAFLARVRADVGQLPAELRARLHVQCYAPSAWPVAQCQLPAGVTLRAPGRGRIGSDVGTIPPADYSAAALVKLFTQPGGPNPAPIPPPAPPAPAPSPAPPAPPAPIPPAPAPLPLWLAGLVGVVLYFLVRRPR